jgi:hypothetical protein
MVARHCSQIPRQENRLGRHYSRFRPIRRIAYQQYQRVAQSRRVKNRKRRRRIGEVRLNEMARQPRPLATDLARIQPRKHMFMDGH